MSSQLEKDNEEEVNSMPPSKKLKRKHVDPDVLEFRTIVHRCCAMNNFKMGMEAFDRAIEKGTRIEAQSFYNLLSLCDGLGNRGIHVGTPKTDVHENLIQQDIDLPTRKIYAFKVKSQMDNLRIPLNETAFTALIKLLSKARELSRAEQVLAEAESTQQCKLRLRLYTPLLSAYCEDGAMLPALNIWHRLLYQGLSLTEREYLTLIKCATSNKLANVFERVFSELAEDILVPSRETTAAIQNWFQRAGAIIGNESDSKDIDAILKKIVEYNHSVPAPTMGPVQSQSSWEVSEGCEVDISTGTLKNGCLQGAKLQPLRLTDEAWREMRLFNDKIVTDGKLDTDTSQFQGGRKGKKRVLDKRGLEERQRHWVAFLDYLKQREGPIDYVIDGANVGYYEQNFACAPKHVSYVQIDWIVRHLYRQNKSILLVMHSRHFSRQMLPPKYESLVRAWTEHGFLYRTPPGMNDDWFWMHAALQGGPRTLVVTNDEMRDHHFQMLAPRSFLRWKERHQVHFSFGDWEQCDRREVILTYPEIYSRRIQRVENGLVIPHPKLGDENRFLDGMHVLDDGAPAIETYLCVRPR